VPGLERQQEGLRSVASIIARELYFADKNHQHAEHHQRLFEERVTRAEALARGLGLQRLTVGPIEWWFDDGDFYWRRLETPQVDGWEQGRLPGCDIDNEEISE
jgi:hypothetical protein